MIPPAHANDSMWLGYVLGIPTEFIRFGVGVTLRYPCVRTMLGENSWAAPSGSACLMLPAGNVGPGLHIRCAQQRLAVRTLAITAVDERL